PWKGLPTARMKSRILGSGSLASRRIEVWPSYHILAIDWGARFALNLGDSGGIGRLAACFCGLSHWAERERSQRSYELAIFTRRRLPRRSLRALSGDHGVRLRAKAAQLDVVRTMLVHPIHGPVEPGLRFLGVTFAPVSHGQKEPVRAVAASSHVHRCLQLGYG